VAAESALESVLELFSNPDGLPDAIAQTVIARGEGVSPMCWWSLPNQLLVILNGSSDARGYRQWKQAGRHVKKGAKAIRILAPRTRKISEKDAAGVESERVICSGFLGVPVFRLEDTEGAELEVPDYDPPALPPLSEVATRLGVTVSYVPFVDRFRGFYRRGEDRIVLCSHDESVFLHELAHAGHERVLQARGESLQGGQVPSQEVVAEVVAATLCKLFDLDGYLPHSREYVESYSGQGGPARAAMRVLADVQAVLLLLLEGSNEAPVSELDTGETGELIAA
jgi:antirestriction protein ArdC